MKRICLAVTNDLSYDQRMHRTCRTLAEAGYQVTLLGRRMPGSRLLPEMPFRCVRLRCLFRRGPAFYAEYNLRLLFWLISYRHDLTVSCDLDTALPVVISAKLLGRKCLHDAHEMFTEVPELTGRKTVRRLWRWLGRLTIGRFNARYTVGPAIAKALEERYGKAFAVVRNVPETRPGEVLAFAARRPVILYQGALNAGRGLESAIDAMHHIEGFLLHLVGEGDLSRDLRLRVEQGGLGEKVRFLGYAEPAQLPAITEQATVGLNLLEDVSLSYYYSLANKFFDYMHAGTPSVNMAFPEYLGIIAEHPVGICIASLEVEAYARQMNALLRDKGQLQKMHDAAVTASVTFNWENEKDRLIRLYHSVG